MWLADLHPEREPEAIDITNRLVTALEILEALEEIGALFHDHRLIIRLADHLQRLERDAGAHGIGIEGRMRRSGREDVRIDELLASPYARQRIEAIGDGLSENEDVRIDAEMLDRPELAGAIDAHLDFIDDE